MPSFWELGCSALGSCASISALGRSGSRLLWRYYFSARPLRLSAVRVLGLSSAPLFDRSGAMTLGQSGARHLHCSVSSVLCAMVFVPAVLGRSSPRPLQSSAAPVLGRSGSWSLWCLLPLWHSLPLWNLLLVPCLPSFGAQHSGAQPWRSVAHDTRRFQGLSGDLGGPQPLWSTATPLLGRRRSDFRPLSSATLVLGRCGPRLLWSSAPLVLARSGPWPLWSLAVPVLGCVGPRRLRQPSPHFSALTLRCSDSLALGCLMLDYSYAPLFRLRLLWRLAVPALHTLLLRCSDTPASYSPIRFSGAWLTTPLALWRSGALVLGARLLLALSSARWLKHSPTPAHAARCSPTSTALVHLTLSSATLDLFGARPVLRWVVLALDAL